MKEATCAILGSILGPAEISELTVGSVRYKTAKRNYQRLDDLKTAVAMALMVPFSGKILAGGLSVGGIRSARAERVRIRAFRFDDQWARTKFLILRLLYE